LIDTILGAFVTMPTQASVKHLSHGVKRCALEELFTSAFDPQMGFAPDTCAEFLDQARLPDSRLAHHKDKLAFASRTRSHRFSSTRISSSRPTKDFETRVAAPCVRRRATVRRITR
jgi:hypothetical protein